VVWRSWCACFESHHSNPWVRAGQALRDSRVFREVVDPGGAGGPAALPLRPIPNLFLLSVVFFAAFSRISPRSRAVIIDLFIPYRVCVEGGAPGHVGSGPVHLIVFSSCDLGRWYVVTPPCSMVLGAGRGVKAYAFFPPWTPRAWPADRIKTPWWLASRD